LKTIEIVVRPDGHSSIQTKGFEGERCQDASRYLEQALGICVGERLTPEFYAATSIYQLRHQQ
jgi:hypothetical protein